MKVIRRQSRGDGRLSRRLPGNGQPFPDGSKMAKVEWQPKKSPDAPYDITVPGAIYDLDFMVKDAKRFADSGGWGYAVFKHDPASGTYTPATLTHKPPQANDAKCGFRVPYDREGKGLRLHGVREALMPARISACMQSRQPDAYDTFV